VQLRFQHSILFAEVLDDVVLPAFEPADKSRENQLQRNHRRAFAGNSGGPVLTPDLRVVGRMLNMSVLERTPADDFIRTSSHTPSMTR
jgi:hypothetical protein